MEPSAAVASPRPTDVSVSSTEPATVRLADSLRAAVAGSHAARLVASSTALFEAGGKHVLSDGAKAAVRGVAERGAARAIAQASGALFEPVAALGAKPIAAVRAALPASGAVAKAAAKGIGKQAARIAAKEVLKGAGRAAGIGFVVDGAVASIEAIAAVRDGTSDKEAAVKHVAKEATTGALATAAGVLAGAGLVALTGGVATPVVFAVGALSSIGTKRILRRVVR